MTDEIIPLEELLRGNDLLDAAEALSDDIYRLKWGSANVITSVTAKGISIVAPMFAELPPRADEFCRRLLSLNADMAGIASFAIRSDGSVILQAGRGRRGLESHEFAVLLGNVGRFADDHDDRLHDEFYAN